MVGITLRKDIPNVLQLNDGQTIINVVWDEQEAQWDLKVDVKNQSNWMTIMTGSFRNTIRVEELINTMQNVLEVED